MMVHKGRRERSSTSPGLLEVQPGRLLRQFIYPDSPFGSAFSFQVLSAAAGVSQLSRPACFSRHEMGLILQLPLS